MNIICLGWYVLQAIVCAVVAGENRDSWYVGGLVLAGFLFLPVRFKTIARIMPFVAALAWGWMAWIFLADTSRTDFHIVATIFTGLFGAGANAGAIEYMITGALDSPAKQQAP